MISLGAKQTWTVGTILDSANLLYGAQARPTVPKWIIGFFRQQHISLSYNGQVSTALPREVIKIIKMKSIPASSRYVYVEPQLA
jgi:hypothetical protein